MGPRPDPPTCSTTWSSGFCATGCSTPWPPLNLRLTRVSTCAAARWNPAPSVPGWQRMPATGGAPASRWPVRTSTYDGDATALGIAAADGEGAYIDTVTLTPGDEVALAAWLGDPAVPKALHEAKVAMHDLEGRGWPLAGVTSDTALAAYLVRPGQRSFALDDLSLRYLRRELRAETVEQQQLSLLDDAEGIDDQAAQTLMLRARAVADLADALDGNWPGSSRRRCSARWNCPCRRCSPAWKRWASRWIRRR